MTNSNILHILHIFLYIIIPLGCAVFLYYVISAIIYAVKYITTEWKIVDNQMKEGKKRLNQYEKYKNEIRNFKA